MAAASAIVVRLRLQTSVGLGLGSHEFAAMRRRHRRKSLEPEAYGKMSGREGELVGDCRQRLTRAGQQARSPRQWVHGSSSPFELGAGGGWATTACQRGANRHPRCLRSTLPRLSRVDLADVPPADRRRLRTIPQQPDSEPRVVEHRDAVTGRPEQLGSTTKDAQSP